MKAALILGESLGVVTKPKDVSKMKGGNFMRVRVAMDITKPLCQGRKVTWNKSKKGWVFFLYEHLPNICYWCGHLSHNEMDCVLWLSRKWTLTMEDQQFGPWIRAPQYNLVRKAVVEGVFKSVTDATIKLDINSTVGKEGKSNGKGQNY